MSDFRYQGWYAESYVRTLAHAVGLVVAKPEPDALGIDLMIRSETEAGGLRSPGIDVQVKSWSRPVGTDDYWRFDGLNERQFNQLVDEDLAVPRYLVVVTVPTDRARFTELTTDGILFRERAFYVSLTGLPRVEHPNSEARRSVRLPKRNLFEANSLMALLHAGISSQMSAS